MSLQFNPFTCNNAQMKNKTNNNLQQQQQQQNPRPQFIKHAYCTGKKTAPKMYYSEAFISKVTH